MPTQRSNTLRTSMASSSSRQPQRGSLNSSLNPRPTQPLRCEPTNMPNRPQGLSQDTSSNNRPLKSPSNTTPHPKEYLKDLLLSHFMLPQFPSSLLLLDNTSNSVVNIIKDITNRVHCQSSHRRTIIEFSKRFVRYFCTDRNGITQSSLRQYVHFFIL